MDIANVLLKQAKTAMVHVFAMIKLNIYKIGNVFAINQLLQQMASVFVQKFIKLCLLKAYAFANQEKFILMELVNVEKGQYKPIVDNAYVLNHQNIPPITKMQIILVLVQKALIFRRVTIVHVNKDMYLLNRVVNAQLIKNKLTVHVFAKQPPEYLLKMGVFARLIIRRKIIESANCVLVIKQEQIMEHVCALKTQQRNKVMHVVVKIQSKN